MGLGDLWGDAVEAAKEMAASNPTAWTASQLAARTPAEALPWIAVQSTVMAEAAERVLNDSPLWDLSAAQLVPQVGETAYNVGEWGAEHRGTIGNAAEWADRIGRLFMQPWFWAVLLVVIALLLLTPLMRAGYRVTQRPRHAYHSVRATYRRGFKGNVKRTAKWWVDPKTQQNRRSRLSIPNGGLANRYSGHGAFAIVEYRNPPPPLKPRAVGIKATDPKSAQRCLVRNFGHGWHPERLDHTGTDLTLYHYVRKAS